MEKEQCNGCETDKYIVNRKRMLCDDCNHFRIHGETKQQTQIKQQQKYQEKYQAKQLNKPIVTKVYEFKPKKNYVIKQSTKKEEVQKNLLSLVKKKIRKEAIDSDTYYCWGCGDGSQDLDCSHILSVKQRKDLELEQENMNLFCRDCHNAWESWDITKMQKLFTFQKDLLYIKEKDDRVYQKILIKIQENTK